MSDAIAVELSQRNWYGHPEASGIDAEWRTARNGALTPIGWTSGLRCWIGEAEDGTILWRAYEPTEKTPRWVWVDRNGTAEIEPPMTVERLTALVVEYRLKGGPE